MTTILDRHSISDILESHGVQRALKRSEERLMAICIILIVLSVALHAADGQMIYQVAGEKYTIEAVQLWYNGYWRHPGWINGTLVSEESPNRAGNIVMIVDAIAPYDKKIIKQVAAGATAVVFLRDRSGVPGQTMYIVDGSDQSQLTVPVVEVFQLSSAHPNLRKYTSTQGIQVYIWPEKNAWKTANENNTFQVTFNVFHSFCELAIIGLAAIRLNRWYMDPNIKLISIGPICLVLELISASLRLAYSIVDPFWTFRLIPDIPSNILLTVSLPFQLVSGILLTFFWAETLLVNKVHASPFISEYKRSAFVCIAILIAGEIGTGVTRIVTPVTSFNPSFVSEAFYAVTCAILSVCYIICAVKILKRLQEMNRRGRYVRNMTIRFAGSTAGYIGFVILIIALIFNISNPWAFKIILNLIFVCANGTAILQVYSFKPPTKSGHSSSALYSQGESMTSLPVRQTSTTHLPTSLRTDYSRVGPPARNSVTDLRKTAEE